MAQLKKPSRRIIDFMNRKSVQLDPKEWYVKKNDTKTLILENTTSHETKSFNKADYENIYF